MVLYLFCLHLYLNYSFSALHEKRIFVLRKFVKRTERIIFSLVFACFLFILYFLKFSSNRNVRKQHLSVFQVLAVFLVKYEILFSDSMLSGQQFLLTILKQKVDIFCRIIAKTSHWSTFRRRCL